MRPYYKPRHAKLYSDKYGNEVSPDNTFRWNIFTGVFDHETLQDDINEGLSYDPYKGEK